MKKTKTYGDGEQGARGRAPIDNTEEAAQNRALMPRRSTAFPGGNGSEPELGELRLPSVLVGRIVSIRESGEPLVDFPGNTSRELVPARSLVPITAAEAGCEVALTFDGGDPSRPIIVGFLQMIPAAPAPSRSVKVDDEVLVLNAKKEVVLQCGKASITLTSAGKVLIRGAYLLSRSSGVNRIKGGSVQIN
jgi:Domain of unknown function (DUF6484)